MTNLAWYRDPMRAIAMVIAMTAGCGRLGFSERIVGDAVGGDAHASTSDGVSDGTASTTACASLPAICGPAGTSSCCGSPLVTGGMFYRSYDVGTDGAFSSMAAPATVSDFRLDTYEITVARFRQFVDAGLGTQQNPPVVGAGARTLNGMANQGGWQAAWNSYLAADLPALQTALQCDAAHQTWTATAGANEALPINCISVYDAMAFCAWDGGFLPTEAEWNYAAAGGSEQRAYPWSSPPSSLALDCSYANFNDGTTGCVNGGHAPNRVGSESPKGDGRWGQADLAGNMGEWVVDTFESNYTTLPCVDCAFFGVSSYQVYRGGDFTTVYTNIQRSAQRWPDYPYRHFSNYGARCARAP